MIPSEPDPSDDPAALQAMLAAERAENERLRKIIRELQRHRFGRRAETRLCRERSSSIIKDRWPIRPAACAAARSD